MFSPAQAQLFDRKAQFVPLPTLNQKEQLNPRNPEYNKTLATSIKRQQLIGLNDLAYRRMEMTSTGRPNLYTNIPWKQSNYSSFYVPL